MTIFNLRINRVPEGIWGAKPFWTIINIKRSSQFSSKTLWGILKIIITDYKTEKRLVG